MRGDGHVHSKCLGAVSLLVLWLCERECYSEGRAAHEPPRRCRAPRQPGPGAGP